MQSEQLASNMFLINSGRDDIQKVGHLQQFNYENLTNYWTSYNANMLNGTDGTLWHPNTHNNERVYTFIPDICRSVYLDFNQSRTNPFSIDVNHFAVPDSAYSNSTENEGFCLYLTGKDKNKTLNCLPSGLFSLSSCVHREFSKFDEVFVFHLKILVSGSSFPIPLPIIASAPHFLGADPSVRNSVDGLSPNDDLHRSFIEIEPITGSSF